MTVRYHELWNHTTSTITVPVEYQNPFGTASWIRDPATGRLRRPRTSLEILEDVLHDPRYRSEFEAADAYARENSTYIPQCLLPNTRGTQKLTENARESSALPLPVLNVGYPKVGSSTLNGYFNCIGLRSNHLQNGEIMYQNLATGKPIFSPPRGNQRPIADAYCQLDKNFGSGHYPQVALLDELHEVVPNATLVMNFRPLFDWFHSTRNWYGLFSRMIRFRLPGLLVDEDLQRSLNKNREKEVALARWWCGHVLHLREYVREYPSHAFVELDLYNAEQSEAFLDVLFKGVRSPNTLNKHCWGHENANPNPKAKDPNRTAVKQQSKGEAVTGRNNNSSTHSS